MFKLAHAASFLVWLHSPQPTEEVLHKLADYAPPAEGEEHAALTGEYKAPLADFLYAVQEMIQTELATAFAYRAYAQSLRGLFREALAEEFEEHADQETEHAEYLMRRAAVLGGGLQLQAIEPPVASTDPVDIVTRMVRMEQEGLAKWRLLHSMIGDSNPMKFKVEEYMTEEEEHTDDLIRMLPEGALPSPLMADAAQGAAPPPAPPAEEEPVAKMAHRKFATLGEAAAAYALPEGAPPMGDMNPVDPEMALEQEAMQAEEEASSAYFQQRAQEQQAQLEQLQQQLQQQAQQLQQAQTEVQQQTQIQQQQQQALTQANDTATRSLAQQISLMQEANQLREQTTGTIAGHDAWRQQVQQGVEQLAALASRQPANPNAPPPEAPAQEGAPQEGMEGPQQAAEPAGPPAQMKQAGEGMDAARSVFAKGFKEHAGPLLEQAGGAKGVLGTLGLSLAGAAHGYFKAKNPETLAKAQASLEAAKAQDEQEGGILSALRLARAHGNFAQAEAQSKHPMLGARTGAHHGLIAGLSLSSLANQARTTFGKENTP